MQPSADHRVVANPSLVSREHFNNLSVEVRAFAAEPDAPLIDEMTRFAADAMRTMNHSFPGLEPDSRESIRNLVVRQGARVVIIQGKVPGADQETERLLGFGVIILGVDNFPDRDHIPPALREQEGASRVIRLFVNDELRRMLPEGEAFSKLLEQVQKVGSQGPIIGMVLENIELVVGEQHERESLQIWLEARRALKARGFDATGEKISEVVYHADGRAVRVDFGWWVYPPITSEAVFAEQQFNDRTERSNWMKRFGLATLATALPPQDAMVLVHGEKHRAFEIARMYPDNLILANGAFAPDREKRDLRSNLRFVEHDEERKESGLSLMGAVLVSGVLPDVALRNIQAPRAEIASFLRDQILALDPGKNLVLRDTVASEIHQKKVEVIFEANEHNRFRRFLAGYHEPLIAPELWHQVQPVPSEHGSADTFRYLMPQQIINEYYLKRLYESDFGRERQRTYTLLDAHDMRAMLNDSGLRIVYAGPEFNQLITSAWNSEFIVNDLSGNRTTPPPTNYTIIAERVREGEGIVIRPHSSRSVEQPKFVSLTRSGLRIDGEFKGELELASRENVTHDVIAYQIVDERLYVRCRVFPRPLLSSNPHLLDGSMIGGYLVEQIAGIVPSQNFGSPHDSERSAEKILVQRSGLRADQIQSFGELLSYRPATDLVDETVVAQCVEISGDLSDVTVTNPYAGFNPTITIRMADALSILGGCQVGTYRDARLERMIYHLLKIQKRELPQWLGDSIDFESQPVAVIEHQTIDEVLSRHPEPEFFEIDSSVPPQLLVIEEEFEEIGRNSDVVGKTKLEAVVPRSGSVARAPLIFSRKVTDESGASDIQIGIQMRYLPPSPSSPAGSAILSLPIFEISPQTSSLIELNSDIERFIESDYGEPALSAGQLGAAFPASPGITPLFYYPTVVELSVRDESSFKIGQDSISWVSLRELEQSIDTLECGLLITAVNRLNHALTRRPPKAQDLDAHSAFQKSLPL
jgi:hypothetical protein